MNTKTTALSDPHDSFTARAALTVLRLVLPFWVGAALLFVMTSIAEQVSPHFDATTRDILATIRFPWYYASGTACCTVTLAAGVLCRSLHGRLTVVLLLVLAASLVYAGDYWFVYRPLQALIIPPGEPRTAEFDRLHELSRNVNAVHLAMIAVAAILTCLPLRLRDGRI